MAEVLTSLTSLRKKISGWAHTSSGRGQLKVTDLRYLPAFVQFLPSTNNPFFYLSTAGERKEKTNRW